MIRASTRHRADAGEPHPTSLGKQTSFHRSIEHTFEQHEHAEMLQRINALLESWLPNRQALGLHLSEILQDNQLDANDLRLLDSLTMGAKDVWSMYVLIASLCLTSTIPPIAVEDTIGASGNSGLPAGIDERLKFAYVVLMFLSTLGCLACLLITATSYVNLTVTMMTPADRVWFLTHNTVRGPGYILIIFGLGPLVPALCIGAILLHGLQIGLTCTVCAVMFAVPFFVWYFRSSARNSRFVRRRTARARASRQGGLIPTKI